MSIVLAAHSAVVLKAENMADKVEWVNKIRNLTQPSKGTVKGASGSEATPSMRQSHSDGSLVSLYPVRWFLMLITYVAQRSI